MSQPNGDTCAFGHAAEDGHCPGITKREWFAGMALQGIKLKANEEKFSVEDAEPFAAQVALLAYTIADAMLQQREKENKAHA